MQYPYITAAPINVRSQASISHPTEGLIRKSPSTAPTPLKRRPNASNGGAADSVLPRSSVALAMQGRFDEASEAS